MTAQVSLRKCASSPELSVVLKLIIIETKILVSSFKLMHCYRMHVYSEDLTPIAFSNSDCSGEPAQMCKLTLAVGSIKVHYN